MVSGVFFISSLEVVVCVLTKIDVILYNLLNNPKSSVNGEDNKRKKRIGYSTEG